MRPLDANELLRLQTYLRSTCGIEVPQEKRYLFETRLADLVDEAGGDYTTLCDRIETEPHLGRRVVERMVTGETSFFRDGHPFSALHRHIIPRLATRRRAEAHSLRPRLRLLSVGCSSGEEPYSVAACLHAWLRTDAHFVASDVSVLAVDVSSEALQRARRARYRADRLETLPAEYRSFFGRVDEHEMTPLPALRETVRFVEANIADPMSHLGCFDIILCRNVIIYFSLALRRRVITQLHELLRPGGVLLLGASENLYSISEAFALKQLGATTYYLKE